jgi:hypothetical protein
MRIPTLLICATLALPAWSEEAAIGYVKTAVGDTSIINGGVTARAEAGTPIQRGSTLKTGAKSSMGVTFKDETVMSFGPDTEITIDEYLYVPAQGKLGLVAKLAKGSLNYISGVIAKLRPEAVSVVTPSGTIGIRGTRFAAKVEEKNHD